MTVATTWTETLLSRAVRCLAIALVAVALVGSAAAVRADQITDDNVNAAMAAAKTPADHEALAAYFTSKAEAAAANADKHHQMLASFSGKMKQNMTLHCKAIVGAYRQQAKDYAAMAKEEETLAKAASKGTPHGMKGM